MVDYVSQFRTFLSDVKKSSANTLESYLRDVKQFISYCASEGVSDISKVNSDFIKKYLAFLDSSGKSETTKSRAVASVRCFYKYLISINVCKTNPSDTIVFKKASPHFPGVLDTKEIMLLLSQPDGHDYKSLRDRAMLELLYATGIKVSEIISLSVYDVNIQLGFLHLRNGDKERIIPIYPAAVKHIAEYINNARPVIVFDNENSLLFTNMNGQPMTRQGFWKIIKFYADKAGIKKDITPHTLRHSFAAHLLENGADIKDIKEMLGHSDISSTQIYANMLKNKYSTSYTRFHPLAK